MKDELVKKLANGKHKIVIGHRGETYEELETRIKDGFIHIMFPETRGGTELGIRINSNSTDIPHLNSNKNKEAIHIEGITKLNYNELRFVADIDFSTKKGEGYLELIKKSNVNN